MWKNALLLLPLLAKAAVVPGVKRDGPNWLGALTSLGTSFFLSPLKPYKIEEVKTTIAKEGVRRINVWYGPFTIKAQNSTERTGNSRSMDPSGTAWMYIADGIPRDITVLKSNVTVVYVDGSKADVSNGIYQHHTFVTSAAKNMPTWFNCGSSRTMFESLSPGSLFIGGSEDKYGGYFTTPDGKVDSGYYIGPNEKLVMNGDLINYTNETKTVYTLNEIEYVPGKIAGMMDASMYVLVPGQCDGQFGLIQSGGNKAFTIKGKPLNITQDGTILAFRGHLHDGGVSVVAKVNGMQVCESKAIYGGADATLGSGMGRHMRSISDGGPHDSNGKWETISEMSQCFGPIQVKKGDTFELEAFYDTILHPARHQSNGGEAEMMALGVTFMAVAGK